MSSEFAEIEKQPHSLLIHPSNFYDYMQQTLGAVNYKIDYDHFFMSAVLFHLLIRRVNVALKMGIIGQEDQRRGVKRKTELNAVAVKRLNQIWHGRIWIYMKRDRDFDITDWKILYEKPDLRKLKDKEEVMECPALKSLDPNTRLKDKELGVRIRTTVPFKYAWWGHDYAQVVTAGKFHWKFAEGVQPMFKSDEEILFSEAYTDVVSREYFHKMIDILTEEWRKWETYVFLEMHKIIENGRYMGLYQSEESSGSYGLIS